VVHLTIDSSFGHDTLTLSVTQSISGEMLSTLERSAVVNIS